MVVQEAKTVPVVAGVELVVFDNDFPESAWKHARLTALDPRQLMLVPSSSSRRCRYRVPRMACLLPCVPGKDRVMADLSRVSLPRIGFIGLGGMGGRMASRLLDAGYRVTVYNRTRRRAEALERIGAQVADSPRALAASADIVLSS